MKKQLPPKTTKFPAVEQRVLEQLLDKNSAGTITPGERVRLEQLVGEAERLMIANARRLARFAKSESAKVPVGAVPVTDWGKPERME